MKKLRVGTRGSQLALAQTNLVCDALRRHSPNLEIEVVEIKTLGDSKQGTARAAFGDKRDWMHELEVAVVAGDVDLTVNSGKDLPGELSAETALLAVLEREFPFDVFIGADQSGSAKPWRFGDLPDGASIGTASLRRRAQLLRLRSDLKICEHRGNITTRIQKLRESSTLSGIVLAQAGLMRISSSTQMETFSVDQMVPAVNQGTLVVQLHRDRDDIRSLCLAIVSEDVQACFEAERACIERLKADCKSALGVYAQVEGASVVLRARVLSQDGSQVVESLQSSSSDKARLLGGIVADELLAGGAGDLL